MNWTTLQCAESRRVANVIHSPILSSMEPEKLDRAAAAAAAERHTVKETKITVKLYRCCGEVKMMNGTDPDRKNV